MSKSGHALTSLLVNQRITPPRYLWVLIWLSIIAYCSPWMVNKGAGLSLGAYDLAEWASLHPSARLSNPILLVSLLLRLPLVFLALIVSFTPWTYLSRAWWVRAGFCLGIVLALLPPLEYLARPSGNANYGQQLGLSAIVLVGSLIGLSGRLGDLAFSLNVFWGLCGGVVTLIGLIQAHNLMRQFDLRAQLGVGALAIVGMYGFIVIANYRLALHGINQTR
jgi:hypothetical protein